jgi:hypothetical protein
VVVVVLLLLLRWPGLARMTLQPPTATTMMTAAECMQRQRCLPSSQCRLC